ncbi:hypothetical protein ABTZ59_25105 [Streptomyces sp. NPDC094034]|uniref:hypothetical protein n=1 Tax=Streptomyces sp. NPDC094034 TaxID=3155309 RepID=UPI00331E9924
MRKITAVMTTAIALSASTLVAAPAARAAEVNLRSFVWSAEKDGKIHVLYEHWDRNSLPSDVTVRIRAKGSDAVLATLGLNDAGRCTTASACEEEQFWTDPVQLPALGVYTVDLVVRAGTAGELLDRDNGEVNYGLAPKLTATADRQSVSYDHRVVTVNGTLFAQDPNTREVKPFAGAGVHTWFTSPDFRTVTVDKTGRFSVPFEFSGYETGARLDVSFQGNDASFPVAVRKQPLKLAVDTPARSVTAPYGSDVPARGKVTRTADDGTEKPAGGVGVVVDGRHLTSTKADGTFAGAFPATRNGATRLELGQEPWFEKAVSPYDFSVKTAATSTFSAIEAAVDKYRKVTFSGKLGVTSGSYPAGTTGRVSIDHSSDGQNWSSVGQFTATYGTAFTRTAPLQGTTGSYWRLRHLGATGVESRVHKLGRQYTEIRDDDVTPEGVRKGTKLTAKGTLRQKSGSTWKAYAGQKVRVYFKPATSGAAWKELGTATTLTNGTFSKQFTAQQDGTWQMRYVDTVKTHYASSGREDYVDVR